MHSGGFEARVDNKQRVANCGGEAPARGIPRAVIIPYAPTRRPTRGRRAGFQNASTTRLRGANCTSIFAKLWRGGGRISPARQGCLYPAHQRTRCASGAPLLQRVAHVRGRKAQNGPDVEIEQTPAPEELALVANRGNAEGIHFTQQLRFGLAVGCRTVRSGIQARAQGARDCGCAPRPLRPAPAQYGRSEA